MSNVVTILNLATLNKRLLQETANTARSCLGCFSSTKPSRSTALARCGLTSKHIESQIQVLSGGEQAKVRFCLLMNRENNVLVLDEPTNHLDVDAKEELKRALKAYKGSILMVCHEPDFYEGWTEVWDFNELM